MSLNSLYRDYFQKSKVFLYPVLEIKRGSSVTPLDTYVGWNDKYDVTSRKLICTYYLRTDADFVRFTTYRLQKHKMFYDYEIIDNTLVAYIFNFDKYPDDWDNVILGRYSKISIANKRKIRNYYNQNNSLYAYVDSYLFPARYYSMYSEILNVPISEFKAVGELCSKPDINKEILVTDNVSISK